MVTDRNAHRRAAGVRLADTSRDADCSGYLAAPRPAVPRPAYLLIVNDHHCNSALWRRTGNLEPNSLWRRAWKVSEGGDQHNLGISTGPMKCQASRALAILRKHNTFELNREEER